MKNSYESKGCVSRETVQIPKIRQESIYDTKELRFSVTYYGNDEEGGAPDDQAQISLIDGQWSVCAYLKPAGLRELASQLCAAAQAIEEGLAQYDEFRRNTK
jgi:hypothetical protein